MQKTLVLSNLRKKKINGYLLGLDVESPNPKNMNVVMSIGYALIDIATGKNIEKNVIYFPFHNNDLQFDGSEFDTYTFWKKRNAEIYDKHVSESIKLGFDPNSLIPHDKKSVEWKTTMRKCVGELADLLVRIENSYRTLAIITDCQFDATVINYLLWKYLDVDPLTMKRVLIDGNLTYKWGMKCIDTSSFVASTPTNVRNLNSSEAFYMTQNNLEIPDWICQHTHSPDDDCERMLVEFLIMWNNCLVKYNTN